MIENIDITHLEKMLNEDGSWWAWGLLDGKYYLTNRHLAIRIDADDAEDCEEGWMILEGLESLFGKKLNNGNTLVRLEGEVIEKDDKISESLRKQFSYIPKTKGIVTPFIYAHDNFRYRYAKFEDFNLFIQDKYISLMFDSVGTEIYAESKHSSAFLCDGDLLILPIKNMDGVIDSSFKEFEKLVIDQKLTNWPNGFQYD